MPRPEILCRPVAGTDEAAVHHRIRHEVFVLEQEVFAASDLDTHDAHPSTIKVVAWTAVDGGWEPGGAVRLYLLEPGIWQGDRLAVLAPFRAWNLGGPLVRFAVDTAAALGGVEMVAHVQAPNVRFFERLGWRRRGAPELYVGLPHQLMAIDLKVAGLRAGRSSAVIPAAGRSPARS
ncbi:MAG TPA: MSMEG_0567/Sll0786 family nitrogen starvation N-acetyltransferase [Acidimicrobiia bacterium]|jgi:putative N-acetyltransferase (TIGR04045 family)|nr:MSMEG_0567/Sll0786 family nitrogen starvation N-acetyltransferase [Acidimicrobiia bacterium]